MLFRNQKLITFAIIIVTIQLFSFFLPTFSKSREYEDVESFSTQQILVNYTDTLNDSDSENLWSSCTLGGFITCVEYISAIAFLVYAIRIEDEDEKKAMLCLLGAASSIALACSVNYLVLVSIFEESRYETTVGLQFGGIVQLLGMLAVAILNMNIDKVQRYSSTPTPTVSNANNDTNKVPAPTEEVTTSNSTLTCPVCGQSGIPKNRRSCPKCDTIFW